MRACFVSSPFFCYHHANPPLACSHCFSFVANGNDETVWHYKYPVWMLVHVFLLELICCLLFITLRIRTEAILKNAKSLVPEIPQRLLLTHFRGLSDLLF